MSKMDQKLNPFTCQESVDTECTKSIFNDIHSKGTASTEIIRVRPKQHSDDDEECESPGYIDTCEMQSPAKLIHRKKRAPPKILYQNSDDQEEIEHNIKPYYSPKRKQQNMQNMQLHLKPMNVKVEENLVYDCKSEESQSQQYQQYYQSEQQENLSEISKEMEEVKSQKKQAKPVQKVAVLIKCRIQDFISKPIPQGLKFRCHVRLEKNFLGFTSLINLELLDQETFILSAKKEVMSFVSSYNLATSKVNHSKRNQNFIGHLKSNFSGTEWKYSISDEEILRIVYQSTVLGYQKIKMLEAIKVNPESIRKKVIVPPLANILAKKPSKQKNILCLKTKKPKLIQGKYKLDFHGLAKCPSSKNFILENQLTHQECFILAKQKQNIYLMQVQYPLSIGEAFSLALTSLDGKILVN